ncbi:hypothetical protein SprV_0301117400 [Sparganum proliferum]
MKELLRRDQSCLRSANRSNGSSPQHRRPHHAYEKTQIPQRRAGQFGSVFNHPSTISHATIARLHQVETNAELDLPPSHHETIWVMQRLSSGKAPGSDAICAEVYKQPVLDNRQLNHTITSSSAYITQHHHPSQASNCHLPRKRKVCISVPSPCCFFAACAVRV